MNDMKDIINRLCDLERRTAKIETQAIEQAAQWDTTDMAHRPNGLTIEQSMNPLDIADRAYFAGKQDGIAEREWVSLTDEEIEWIVDLNTSDDGGFDIFCDGQGVARSVMDKLKERNNG